MKKLPEPMNGKIVELRNGERYFWDGEQDRLLELEDRYGFIYDHSYDKFGIHISNSDHSYDIIKVYDSNFKKIWSRKEKIHNFEDWNDLIGCKLTFRNGETAKIISAEGELFNNDEWSTKELSKHYKFHNLKRKKSTVNMLWGYCNPSNFDIIKIEKNKILYERKDK